MEPFKNVFNIKLVNNMAVHFAKQDNKFDQQGFCQHATKDFNSLELKARSNQIVEAMCVYLPEDFLAATQFIEGSLAPPSIEEKHPTDELNTGLRGWAIMPMADYVALRGQTHLERSLSLLQQLTMRFSAEFAIRPFLDEYAENVLPVLHDWCAHNNVHVRRLVSEGTRPRLPWGMQLKKFVADPCPIIALLEKLKDDPDEYVRRSVANNLNDIAKDHPDLVATIAADWLLKADKNRQRLVKHGCRTLLKQGHPRVLKSFGFHPAVLNSIKLDLNKTQLHFGDVLTFTLSLTNGTERPQRLMIDYAIHHLKANGTRTAKVFKWKNIEVAAGKSLVLQKNHGIKPITTRVYYPGTHFVEVIINGQILHKQQFELVMKG